MQAMSNAALIGLRIRELRKLKNLTQDQLAEAINSTGSYIGRLERGERNVKLSTLEKVADALQVSVFSLFDDELRQSCRNEVIREALFLLLEQSDSRQRKGLKILKELYSPE